MPPNTAQDLAQEILAPPAKAAIFLTLTVNDGAEPLVRDTLGKVAALTRAVSFRIPESHLTCVTAIGAHLWERMYKLPAPAHLHPFAPVVGHRHQAVSTPGDLFFHLRATRLDLCFELCHQLMRSLSGLVEPVDEVHGFRYWDERDLLGFVDGTESPQLNHHAAPIALVGAEDAAYTGGSYVVVQKYLHDLTSWEALSVAEQERIIGREKLTDVELPDGVKPPNAHVVATSITDPDGTARQIVRDNMPFGNVAAGEFGTYFIGYTADPRIIERMLHSMFVGEPPGNTDRILEFSTPVTGGLFFAPAADFLESASTPSATTGARPSDSPARGRSAPSPQSSSDHVTTPASDPESATTTASLGIGSLKRRSNA